VGIEPANRFTVEDLSPLPGEENTCQNTIDVAGCSDYVLTHGKPPQRFAGSQSVLDLRIHKRNGTATQKIHKTKGS
jgi:hypothetical protein